MATVTFEQAKRCPKCDNPGEEIATRPTTAEDGSRATLHIIRCQNAACRWFDTDWIVQRMSDGTVPVRETSERAQKTFPAIPGMTQEKAQQQVQDIVDEQKRRR